MSHRIIITGHGSSGPLIIGVNGRETVIPLGIETTIEDHVLDAIKNAAGISYRIVTDEPLAQEPAQHWADGVGRPSAVTGLGLTHGTAGYLPPKPVVAKVAGEEDPEPEKEHTDGEGERSSLDGEGLQEQQGAAAQGDGDTEGQQNSTEQTQG